MSKAILVIYALHFVLISVWAQDSDNFNIDHISIVFNDLSKAKSSFRNLGFTIKDGRKHENTIENAHIKFQDGTALELITAIEAKDDLASMYIMQKALGDGPVFLCISMQDPNFTENLLSDYRPEITIGNYYQWITFPHEKAISYLFLIKYSHPPVDTKKLVTHQNGVLGIKEIKLSKPEFELEKGLFSDLGFIVTPGEKIKMNDKVISFTKTLQTKNNRVITSITFWVEDIHETLEILPKGIPFHISKDSVIALPPDYSHGTEIRFEQKF